MPEGHDRADLAAVRMTPDPQAVADIQQAAKADLAWRKAGGPCRTQQRIHVGKTWATGLLMLKRLPEPSAAAAPPKTLHGD
jgi:hypothetical protein